MRTIWVWEGKDGKAADSENIHYKKINDNDKDMDMDYDFKDKDNNVW